MELAAEDIAFLNRGCQLGAVLGYGGDVVAVGSVVGVDEVHAVAVVQIFEQGALFFYYQAVPTDVGYLQALVYHVGYRAHAAVYQPEPLVLAVLVALIKKQLHTEADAHDRLA